MIISSSASRIQKFSRKKLLNIGSAQGLTSDGADYVLRVIRNGPSRAVNNKIKNNVTSIYPSVVMQETRQAESKRAERFSLLCREFDPATFLFWMDQPEPVAIEGIRKDGRRHRAQYTADLLDIERTGIFVTEAKLKPELDRLVIEQPSNWILDSFGYQNLPAKEAFSRLGILHRVEFPDSFAPILAENIQLLLQASRSTPLPNEVSIVRSILRVLRENPLMRIDKLMQAIGSHDTSPLLRLIERKAVTTLIRECRLTFTNCAWVSLGEEPLISIKNNLRQIQTLAPSTEIGSAIPTPSEVARMLKAVTQLEGTAGVSVSERTMRRYRKIFREKGLQGLKGHYVGNKDLRLTSAHEDLILSAIRTYYERTGSMSLKGTYDAYMDLFKKLKKPIKQTCGKNPVCRETFRRRLIVLDPSKLEESRGGRRGARAAERPTLPESRNLPASRAFQTAHIDHCQIKLFLISRQANGKPYVTRAWLTFMVDEHTGYILAAVLTFDNPSRRTCARVLRDCIRRNGHLPEAITTDQGIDFRSRYMGEFMAWKVIEHFLRPTAAGKWGHQVESMFRQFLRALDGIPGQMIKGTIRSRSVSRSHKPHVIARLTLEEAQELLEKFIRWSNDNIHGRQLLDATALVKSNLETFSCSGHPASLDIDTLVMTSVPLSKQTVKIGRKGIHIQDNYYWCSEMAGREGRRISNVRIDPEDDAIIWINFGKGWRAARSNESVRRTAANLRAVIAQTVSTHEAPRSRSAAKLDRDAAMGNIHRAFSHRKSRRQNYSINMRKISVEPRTKAVTRNVKKVNWSKHRREVAEPIVVMK